MTQEHAEKSGTWYREVIADGLKQAKEEFIEQYRENHHEQE